MKIKYLFCSFALHSLVFLSFKNKILIPEQTERQGTSIYEGILIEGQVKQKKKSILQTTKKDKDSEIIIKKEVVIDADKECPNKWYGGVGMAEVRGIIMEIFSGYAADRAGLMVGDVIVKTSDPDILGIPGTSFRMTIKRGNRLLEFTLIRCKVCF